LTRVEQVDRQDRRKGQKQPFAQWV
jgi:hypothetical protein